ncbi:Glucose-6-phosphate isomerase 1, chloroplastic [Vitis vinifera]|uniref:Glucose-6-phosphate isomerase 1, chloroplastic n=1 Tax=Vitis vinifera TaxID=29760 RepID=A0A438FZF9_VITVI|nr:Glucose-6-phosphate isomerase 1, chloroplastic [Vitis vinifera]
MASVSGICSSSYPFKSKHFTARSSPSSTIMPSFRIDSLTFPTRPKLDDRTLVLTPSVAREVSADLSKSDPSPKKKGLEKDPGALWRRYVDWLYQHKELGLFLDVSRIGFSEEFVEEMEPRFQAAFRAMQELEKGAIANPDEGRMIENTLEAVCKFAEDVVSGKIKPPSLQRVALHMSFLLELEVRLLDLSLLQRHWLLIILLSRFNMDISLPFKFGDVLKPLYKVQTLPFDVLMTWEVLDFLLGERLCSNLCALIRFIDNTDPAGIDHQIAQLGPELASTIVIVISKSGGTPETRNGLLEVQKAFREAGLDFAKQVLTSGHLKCLQLAYFLLHFRGLISEKCLLVASLMDEANRTTVQGILVSPESRKMQFLIWLFFLTRTAYYYSVGICSNWSWNQLERSFDLDGNRVNQGLTVYGNKGSTDQHAYIQQLREGVHNFFVTFIEVLRDRPPGHDWELEPGVTCG